MSLGIKAYISLSPSGICFNDEMFLKVDHYDDLKDFFKQLYTNIIGNYPKFHKMDNLSKIGLLMTEVLVRKELITPENEGLGIVFANPTSSKTVDQLFENSRIEEAPSPALFVYTLPNISIGELTIRHKFFGESLFLLSPRPDFYQLKEAILSFSGNEKINSFLYCWIEDDEIPSAKMLLINNDKTYSLNDFELVHFQQLLNG